MISKYPVFSFALAVVAPLLLTGPAAALYFTEPNNRTTWFAGDRELVRWHYDDSEMPSDGPPPIGNLTLVKPQASQIKRTDMPVLAHTFIPNLPFGFRRAEVEIPKDISPNLYRLCFVIDDESGYYLSEPFIIVAVEFAPKPAS